LPGSSPRVPDPLQSSFALTPARSLSGAGFLPGFQPSCDVSGRVHSPRGFPGPRYVPSAGALNLSTAFSALRLHGLVSSRSRIQGIHARSGAYLLHAATASSSEASAPLPLLTGRSPARVWRPQPVTSASRPSSAWSSRSRESVVSLPSGHSPPRVCAPPGLLFPPWSRFTREPPLMKLHDQTFARAFALAPA